MGDQAPGTTGESEAHVEKDRGNPGVLKVYPYPHPLKTPTLVKGRGF